MEEGGPKVRRLTAEEEDAGQRLDNFLFRTLKGVPKSHVYRLLRTGQVRVNKKRVKPDYRLEAGDCLQLGAPLECEFFNAGEDVCRYVVGLVRR